MNRISAFDFQQAIRATHSAEAELVDTVEVDERFEGEPIWQGTVHVFRILDHHQAERCYCWEDGAGIVCVLGSGPITSAVKAVRASILAEGDQ